MSFLAIINATMYACDGKKCSFCPHDDDYDHDDDAMCEHIYNSLILVCKVR